MKVQNMTSSSGNKVANQFIIKHQTTMENCTDFVSYESNIISKRTAIDFPHKQRVLIDRKYWDYSKTTGKYRNQFLGETKKETQKKIDSGEYILADLN